MANTYNSQAEFFRNSNSDYEVSGLSYPADLLGASDGGINPYGQNYVMFNINVHEDSKLAQSRPETLIPNVTSRLGRQISGQNFTVGEVAGATGLLAGGAGALTGGIIGGGEGGAASGGVVGAGIGLATVANTGGVGVNDISSLDSATATANREFTASYKRIKAAIALHVPNNLTARYSVQYEEADTMGFQAMGMMARGLGDAGSSVLQAITSGSMDGLGGRLSEAMRSSQAANALTAGYLSNGPGGKAISALSGQAANPKKEQVFSQVDFRTFTFDYQFFPRSEVEAVNVQNIIRTFKKHMHPEFRDGTDFIYIYPAEFDISYYSGEGQNVALHRHASCVLTEMNLNYSPNGQFATFENGIPTQINMSMTFRELVPMTKETLAELGEID